MGSINRECFYDGRLGASVVGVDCREKETKKDTIFYYLGFFNHDKKDIKQINN